MWERRKSEIPTQAPVMPSPVSLPPAPRVPDTPPPRETQIGKSMSIVGNIYSEEDLYIDGEVQGEIEARESKLTVGPNGKAHSNLKAQEVLILGQVKGDIEAAQKITIRRQGSLVGNIRTTGIVIDDDAYFKGSIDIVRRGGEGASS